MTAKDTMKKGKHMNEKLKIVVIGGTGLIGTKVVKTLRERGYEVVPASPSSGVNTIIGEGLAQALEGAQVVVDVANAPSWEDKAVLDFNLNNYFGRESLCVIKGALNPFDLLSLTRTKRAPHKGGK
jgi:NAD(P)-dependent dehydrogenase (short-subunit alcohol dehydrogenase family)